MLKKTIFPILAIGTFFIHDTFAVTYRCIEKSSNAEYNKALCEAECDNQGLKLRNLGCGPNSDSWCHTNVPKFKGINTCRCWCIPK
ncbi:MAG: hypothetical protein BGO67_08290 [Alphaproteobacteria bacterium 41-28]|mgnify:CR=1 FL=1|nr:MAG: hypothetical protein BGO67_08290 [Alphaproteobacteria bacterium 41-28]